MKQAIKGKLHEFVTRLAVGVAAATDVAVERLEVSAYTVPTDEPESDGTLEWDSTTIVVVEAHAGGETGIGWTYGADGDRRAGRRRSSPAP